MHKDLEKSPTRYKESIVLFDRIEEREPTLAYLSPSGPSSKTIATMKKPPLVTDMDSRIAAHTRPISALGLPWAAEAPRIGKAVMALSLDLRRSLRLRSKICW